MPSPEQWTLPLSAEASGEDWLVVGACNETAARAVIQSDWSGGLYLEGPPSSGKSLLAGRWADERHAQVVRAEELDLEIAAAFAAGENAVVENLEGISRRAGEEALFHLLNALRRGGRLLLTARIPARALDLSLPDLQTRLNALPAVRIEAPDDSFLERLMLRLAERRQLVLPEGIIHFLISRMTRSHEAAVNLIDALDRLSLQSGRPVTKDLAQKALASAAR